MNTGYSIMLNTELVWDLRMIFIRPRQSILTIVTGCFVQMISIDEQYLNIHFVSNVIIINKL